MSKTETTFKKAKNALVKIIGGGADIVFTTYLLWRAIRSDSFNAAMPYLMLFGVWCCSMSLGKIKDILDDKE